jgi:hypothetical protein
MKSILIACAMLAAPAMAYAAGPVMQACTCCEGAECDCGDCAHRDGAHAHDAHGAARG